ncbi:hypothetical protein QOZ80_4BG0348080 [Eleusine coracana subsp. coracana]|nr:hypothetical protein QOZ80_4BG0348080 [Eleusine coracana subsp. coracana]
MAFWVLMDYDAEVWSLKHRINLEALASSPSVDLVTLFFSPARVVVLLDNNECDEMLLAVAGRVLRCDFDGNFLGLREFGGWGCFITCHSLRETMLRHPFFEMQEVAVNDGLPFRLGV